MRWGGRQSLVESISEVKELQLECGVPFFVISRCDDGV
jgi:hypothetical protein